MVYKYLVTSTILTDIIGALVTFRIPVITIIVVSNHSFCGVMDLQVTIDLIAPFVFSFHFNNSSLNLSPNELFFVINFPKN